MGAALTAAAHGVKERVLDLLLRRGAEIDLQDKDGDTALMLAAEHNRPAVVLRLLRAGADMKLRDAAGKTALQWAKEEGHAECVQAFRTHLGGVAAGRSKAASAEAGGAGAAVGASAAASASSGEGGAEAKPSGGAVPEEVLDAAWHGDEAAVLAWVDGGGRVNATFEYVFSDGPLSSMTLLMLAVICGRECLAEALLQRGADTSLQAGDGSTALNLAALNGFEKLVKLALRHGAEINLQCHYGNTALIWAAFYGHSAALLCLLRAGADVTLHSADGNTALQVAKEQGHAAEHAAAEKAAEKAAEEAWALDHTLGSDRSECVTWVTLGHGPHSEIGAARSALSC